MFVPNVASSWSESTDKRTYTFRVRNGIRWSDGTPFTAEDIMFWYRDVVGNNDLTPSKPGWLTQDGKLATVTAPDEMTVVFSFEGSHPFFMESIVSNFTGARDMTRIPAHYLKQFHPTYASQEDLRKRIADGQVDTWYQLFQQKMNPTLNPDLPTLAPWKLSTTPQQQLQIAERNPYYWKVDPQGNQLPYIDQLAWQNITDPEVKILRAISGEIDLGIVSFRTTDIPVLKENEASGKYMTVLLDLSGLEGAGIALYVNQDYQGDENMTNLLRNVDFRRALSLAINRTEVNEFTAFGLASQRQATLRVNHPAGSEEFATAFTEYDPLAANALLDGIGLTRRDNEGYRRFPDGQQLLLILSPQASSSQRVDAAEIIKAHLELVDIRAVVRPEESSLWVERSRGGQHQISVSGNDNGLSPIARPHNYFPVAESSSWAPLTGLYYATGGEEGSEPKGLQAELIRLYEAAAVELDEEKQNEFVREAMRIHAENLFQIGVIGYAPWPMVKSLRMKNVPDRIAIADWDPYTFFPEQYYIEE